MLSKVAEVAEPCEFETGTEIITHGDKVADSFYIMTKGKVAVKVPAGNSQVAGKPAMKEVAQMVGPKSFGGIALLYGIPRTTTIEALEACQCYKINRKAFKMVFQTLVKKEKIITCLGLGSLLTNMNVEFD